MNKDIINLFKLQGLIVDRQEIKEKSIVLHVRSPRTRALCPHCELSTSRIHDRRFRLIKHSVFETQTVFLSLRVRRFMCPHCHHPFSEAPPPGVSRLRSTGHFRRKVLSALQTRSFADVGREFKLSTPTQVRYLTSAFGNYNWPKEGEITLAVDEHGYSKRNMKLTIALPSHHQLVGIWPKATKTIFVSFLQSIPDEIRPRIKEVTMDMTMRYRKAVEEELPQAQIVADHFHVIRYLNEYVEKTRRIIQELGPRGHKRINRFSLIKGKEKLSERERQRLLEVFDTYRHFPTLYHCYSIKERLRDIYRLTSLSEATKAYDNILLALESEEVGVLKDIYGTLLRWREPTLNYFHRRSSNGFIEGVHTKIKTTKRISYGFRNFENYVMKITLACSPHLFEESPH